MKKQNNLPEKLKGLEPIRLVLALRNACRALDRALPEEKYLSEEDKAVYAYLILEVLKPAMAEAEALFDPSVGKEP